jgi:hypothetical protein
MLSAELQQIVQMLLDDSTPSSVLRKLAEDHEFNPSCRRRCQLCAEFCENEFKYSKRKGTGFAVFPLYFFGDAIVNHINCDDELFMDLEKWILKVSDGDWTRAFYQAAISNPLASRDQLLKVGKESVTGYDLLLVKSHPNLTKDIEKEILLAREWKAWPKRSLLIDNLCIDNEDEDFDSIRIYPRNENRSETMTETTFENQASVLSELWVQYKGEEEFEDFFEYNDLGLPLAFAFAQGIVTHTAELEKCIGETWKLFLEGLEVEDLGYESLEDLLDDD